MQNNTFSLREIKEMIDKDILNLNTRLQVYDRMSRTKMFISTRDMKNALSDYFTFMDSDMYLRRDDFEFTIINEEDSIENTNNKIEITKKTAARVVASTKVEVFEEELNKVLSRDDIEIINVDYCCSTDPMTNDVLFSALVTYSYNEPI